MAAAMHANRGYWATLAAAGTGANVTIAGTTVTNPPAGTADCATTSCVPAAMAAYDLREWAKALTALLPNAQATVSCTVKTPQPCTINIVWTEKTVAMNKAQATSAEATSSGTNNPSYTLYVEP
jgi:type IV pilus assembly protein PilV